MKPVERLNAAEAELQKLTLGEDRPDDFRRLVLEQLGAAQEAGVDQLVHRERRL